MLDTETNAGGCSKHGPFHISGHANANCPEQANTKKTESEASKQEAWLNEERETTYRTLIDEIQEASEKGMSGGQYLAELVEKHAKDYGTKVRFGNWLKPEEYEKIRFVLLNSASLNEVAGTVIQRPLFVAEDEKTYQHLEAMFDMKAGDSHGVHFSPGFFDEKTSWGKVGLILTKDSKETAIHETRHSVDPFLAHGSDKRTGYNRALAEIFAFYKKFVIDKKQPDWDGLTNRVSHYHEEYTKSLPEDEKRSLPQFSHSVSMVVKGLEKLHKKFGNVETQRKLVQTKTLIELIQVYVSE